MTINPAVMPNPFAPILPSVPAGRATKDQVGLQRQRTRRAEILAATRRLLAEAGHARLTLRSISEACDVTVQTIHNSFGCRLELLMSALNEHTTSMEEAAFSMSSGPVLFLNLAQMYYQCAIDTPEFLREMVSTAFSTKRPLIAMQRHGTVHKTLLLREMARRQMLRENVNPEMLAEQITRVNTFAVYEWSQHDDAEALRRQIILGNRLLLLGAVRPPADRDIEGWIGGETVREAVPN